MFEISDPITTRMTIATAGLAVLFITGLILDMIILAGSARQTINWNSLSARLQSRQWKWKDCLILFLALYAAVWIPVLVMDILNYFRHLSGSEPAALPLLTHITIFHGTAIIAIILLMRSSKLKWRESFGLNAGNIITEIRRGMVFYIAAMPTVLCLGLISQLLLRQFGYDVTPQNVVTILNTPSSALHRICLITAAVIFAPIIEELVFRGIALPLALKHMKVKPAIILVSLLFTALHFHAPSAAPLFAIATAFSIAYLRSGSILTPIIMHILFNAVSITVLMVIGDLNHVPFGI